jgi:hypothetical protein
MFHGTFPQTGLVSRFCGLRRKLGVSSHPSGEWSMQATITQWLAGIGWTAFTWALAALIVVNVGAFVAFTSRGDRSLVERYTSWWLAANLFLLSIGVGIPAITAVTRLALLGASAVLPEIRVSAG